MKIRAFARTIGVDESAVRKAIGNGRLERSIDRDHNGRPFIADVDLARVEWRDNFDPSKARPIPPKKATPQKAQRKKRRTGTITRARQRLVIAQAERMELRSARDRGELVPLSAVIREGQAFILAAKAAIRALPSRMFAAGLIASAEAPKVTMLLHEALSEMSRWSTELDLKKAAAKATTKETSP